MATIHEQLLGNDLQLLCCPLTHLHSMRTVKIRAFAICWSICASAVWAA